MRRPTSSSTSESNIPMNETTMHKFDSYRTLRHLRYLGLLILFASLVCQTVYAEGSRDLIRNGGNRAFLEHRTGTSGSYVTAGIPRVTVIRVYAEANEVVALGSSANGVGSGTIRVRGPGGFTPYVCPPPGTNNTGKILNRSQEVAGPNYNGVNPGGYTPCTFVALNAGIYEIDFTQPATANNTNPTTLAVSADWPAQTATNNWVTAWDVTVFDGNVAQSGRVFARYYALNLGSGNARVNLDVIVQTIDGYRYELEQDIEPFGFIFFANRKGFRDGEGKALYRSIQLNNDDTLQPGQTFNAPDQPDDIDNNEVTHKIFLNEPDGSMPATAATPSGTDTWLYRADAKAPPIPQDFAFTGRDGTQNQAGTGLGGTFSFVNPLDGTDDAPAPNAYNITLEFSSGATPRVLAGTADPDVTTEVKWDGKDGDGDDVPAGSGDFIATVRLFAGEVHFPFLDVEDAPTGITITRLNTPAGSATTGIADPGRIYYDDSVFTNGQKELDGIITPPAAHTFTGDFGNHRGIDTWVYYPTSEPEQASIVIREADLSVAMTDDPDPVLPGGPISYTFTVSNLSDGSEGTVDAVDADVTDTFPPELTNVQWRCEITAEGTFADEPLSASSCAASSGTGDIDTTVNLKRGATATFTVTATVAQNASGTLTNTATVRRGTDASDPDASNDEASETTTIDANPGVAGSVFDDANANGTFDSGESGLAGVTVVLYDPNVNSCRAAQTNAAGDYVFTNVTDGAYQLIEAASETAPSPAACPPLEEDPAGYGSTTANTLAVNVAGSSVFNQNFGDSDNLDYGDAPASYGDAQHAVPQTPELYLGAIAPDEESQPQNAANGGADGTGDDANGTDDEDAFSTLPPLATDSSSYTLEVPLTSGSSVATLYGWVDFDGDGRFSASEAATANVAAGASTATLSWNSANGNAPTGLNEGTTFARLRLTTDDLTDEASTTEDERAAVAATDGEGEDYPVEVLGRVYTCPAAKADLWFANDESGSVDATEFDNALDFLYQISDEFIYDDIDGVKAGVTAWADLVDSIEVVMPITETFGDPGDSGLISSGSVTTDGDGRGLRELYSSRQNTSQGTRLDYATNYLADLIEAGNGRRVDTPQVAVILTDAFDYQLNDAADGGGDAWIAEADRLRNAGPDGTNILVIVTEAAATAYNTNSTSKATVDAVAGANGLVVVAPTYAEAADATNGYVQQVVDAVCELAVLNAPQVDLSLSKEVDNDAPAEGDLVTFTLTLENGGPDDATDVEVTDLLPSGLRFFSASSAPQPTNYDQGTGVWEVGTLASGSSATLTLTARVETGAPAQITNSAQVSALEQNDADSAPNNDDPDEDDQDAVTLNVYRVSPAAGDIVINELLFNQSKSGNIGAADNDEFIELYNASSNTVDLSGWQLVDANLIANDPDGPSGNINGNSNNAAVPYTFPSVQLAPGEYAVIWVGERAVSRDVPAAFQTWLGRNPKLSNSGDDMWLYDAEGRIVDYIAYGPDNEIDSPAPPDTLGLWNKQFSNSLSSAAKGQSISLTPNGQDSNSSACWEPTTSGLANIDGRCPGYLPTRDSDARVVDGVERVTSIAQNNNGFEKRITGTLFYDDGLNSGTANNALQEVDEQGVPGVVITATDGTNTVSTTTDGAGNYSLIIPDTFGDEITLSHLEQPATGYNDGTTVTLADTFKDADVSSVTFTLNEQATYNFGVVRESTLRPDQSGQVGPGNVISYTHLFTPGTPGEVSLSVTGSYSYQVFSDAGCDGIIQTSEQVDVLGTGVTVDETWPRAEDGSLAPCTLELRVFVPEGEPSGRLDLATLSANLTYANNANVVETLSVTDVTTVTVGGRLELSKRVANVTVNPDPVDADFSTVGEGKPGDVLEYCITYQNLGTETLTQTQFSDPVPFFTSFETDAYGAGQDIQWTDDDTVTYLSATTGDDAGELNGGVVQVAIGEVDAGEAGEVCYRVRIR